MRLSARRRRPPTGLPRSRDPPWSPDGSQCPVRRRTPRAADRWQRPARHRRAIPRSPTADGRPSRQRASPHCVPAVPDHAGPDETPMTPRELPRRSRAASTNPPPTVAACSAPPPAPGYRPRRRSRREAGHAGRAVLPRAGQRPPRSVQTRAPRGAQISSRTKVERPRGFRRLLDDRGARGRGRRYRSASGDLVLDFVELHRKVGLFASEAPPSSCASFFPPASSDSPSR